MFSRFNSHALPSEGFIYFGQTSILNYDFFTLTFGMTRNFYIISV